MKVLFDHQIFSSQISGGISRYFYELQKALPSQGVETELGFPWTISQYLLRDDQAAPHALWGDQVWKGKAHVVRILNQMQVCHRLRGSDFDLFHPTYYDPYFIKNLKRPFILTVHDMIHELFGRGLSDVRAVRRNKKTLCHKAAAIITVSEKTREDLISHLAIPEEKIHVVHHGNNLSPARVSPHELKIPERYILFVGQRHSYKNWEMFMRSFWQVSKNHPELYVILVGAQLNAHESEFVRNLGCADRVIVRSFVRDEELAYLYQKADFFVFPSLYEGFGFPLIEAMSWGCPVLAAQASCFPEIAKDAALYFDPMSLEDLVQKMERLLNEPGLLTSLRAAGFVQASCFTWEKCARETAEIYRSVS